LLELLLADTNDDDREREPRSLDDESLSLCHVVDLTVRDDQEDVVNFIGETLVYVLYRLLQDGGEVGRTIEADVGELLTVLLENVLNSLDLGVANISVQREAVVHVLIPHVLRNTSEAIDWE
jgi:hypothetical protein